jgi:hypothetical protein
MSNNTFIFNHQKYSYFTKLDARLKNTERAVELGLLEEFLKLYKTNKKLIEIGCVSPYYFEIEHPVYDIQDSHLKNIKMNAKNIDLYNKYLLSISTIEHFDINGYNIHQNEFLDPIIWLARAISHSDGYFVTFPLGFNKRLDTDILLNQIKNITFLCRLNYSNIWIQKNINALTEIDKSYDFTFTRCANSIAIIQNLL